MKNKTYQIVKICYIILIVISTIIYSSCSSDNPVTTTTNPTPTTTDSLIYSADSLVARCPSCSTYVNIIYGTKADTMKLEYDGSAGDTTISFILLHFYSTSLNITGNQINSHYSHNFYRGVADSTSYQGSIDIGTNTFISLKNIKLYKVKKS